MKKACGFFLFCTLLFCKAGLLHAQAPLKVSTFRFADAKGIAIGVGFSCAYTRLGGSDTFFVYAVSYSSKTAAIRINGRLEVLKQVGSEQSDLFANARYSVSLAVITDDKEDGLQHGSIIVRDKRTGRKLAVRVEGACDI